MPLSAGADAWNNGIIKNFRENEGRVTIPPFVGATLLLLTTSGARSGLPRTAPLGYQRGGDGYVVIGSNSGLPANPEWFHNLKSNPVATAEVGAETFQVRARFTEGAERRRLFDATIAKVPAFGEYEGMTDRELPVIVLEPVDKG